MGFVDSHGAPAPAPERAVAFCGIARPDAFERTLRDLGIEIAALEAFPDHFSFGGVELRRLADLARERRAALVTTEKDLARLTSRHDVSSPEALRALRIEVAIENEARLIELVEAAVSEEEARCARSVS